MGAATSGLVCCGSDSAAAGDEIVRALPERSKNKGADFVMGAEIGECPSVETLLKRGDELQEAVDAIFKKDVSGDLASLSFSLTIADPLLADCPLIGCSTGFGELCGYEMDEIVGRNCRFLVESVPVEHVDTDLRRKVGTFCAAIREGADHSIPAGERPSWQIPCRHSDDGLFCVQTNIRKDGSLFRNMFYLVPIELSDKPYILGLQTEIFEEGDDAACIELYRRACRVLDSNMAAVERVLASMFWVKTAMRRQDFEQEEDDGFDGFEEWTPAQQD